jgi:hypothetical protein
MTVPGMPHRLLAAMLVTLPLAWSPPATACDCAGSWTESLAGSDHVMVGKVTHVATERTCDPKRPRVCTETYTHDVTVERVWKGKVAAKVRVVTNSVGAGVSCTFGKLPTNLRMLFITTAPTDGAYRNLHTCSGTRDTTPEAEATVTQRLGAPRPPA